MCPLDCNHVLINYLSGHKTTRLKDLLLMIIEAVKKNLIPSEDFIFGFADLHGLINKKYTGYNYGISIGKRLEDKIIDRIKDGPTLEYFNYYNLINRELADLTSKIHIDLQKIGVDSIALEPTISEESQLNDEQYLKTLSADISHKMVATRAGLGWIGKTDLFISKEFGPRLRLVSILLDQKPESDQVPVEESECGKCNVCVVKCPAKAANGKLWNIKVSRDDFFDAHKCREKCSELARKKFNIDIRLCGICVSVCPVSKDLS
jgi:epoxyqueuosine reductase QueG